MGRAPKNNIQRSFKNLEKNYDIIHIMTNIEQAGSGPSLKDRIIEKGKVLIQWIESQTPEARYQKGLEDFGGYLKGYGAAHQLWMNELTVRQLTETGQLTPESRKILQQASLGFINTMKQAGIDPQPILDNIHGSPEGE